MSLSPFLSAILSIFSLSLSLSLSLSHSVGIRLVSRRITSILSKDRCFLLKKIHRNPRRETCKVKFNACRNRLKSVEACNTRRLILIKLLKSLESRERSIEYFVFLLVLFAACVVERYSFSRFDRKRVLTINESYLEQINQR